ncbi:PHB depolymerase family esterase [Saccharopolyspora rhizosphaerae]|uniref:PHB depolymerase family esterase n=1 Tax=Saccharopolyspora rhizosphaerae TaxID=2492662 RepID=A0A426JKL1_9PSEU|nr:PHB depolymerase family esterase [Saccharopolyspora rhizosphaerae]RRO13701.1 PHB depolymerase family esterase [Saccharopolyspora rhizosphaerae]
MTSHPRPPVRTALRAAGRRASAGALAVAAVLLTAPPAQAAATLEPVTGFDNPGALSMYAYRPADLPAEAPVVVALHGCTQNAQDYADHSGLTEFADQHGFLLVFAEQSTANNANRCFNWFQPGDITRDQGEAASLRNMVGKAVDELGGDGERVYVTGLSAGGAMTSVMLAAYPDVFEAGAVVAGLPYQCATTVAQAFTCMNPGVDKSPEEWAELARSGHPSWDGPWPRVAIWHGTADTTVVPRNADELRDQWTAVHGVPHTPTRTSTLPPNDTEREEYTTADGTVVVEVDRVPDMEHGTPVHPGDGPEDCGQVGQYYPDTICSSYHVTRFFGLDAG